jgi:thiol-disulfide isomerase/thioredoxin
MNIYQRKGFLKFIIIILLVIIFQSLKLHAIERKNDNYFPLVDYSLYTYEGKYKDKTYKDTIILKTFSNESLRGYYFVKKQDFVKKNYGRASIDTNMFGLGFYYKEGDKLYTTKCKNVKELNSLSKFDREVMLIFPLKKGKKNIIHDMKILKYSLLKMEITVIDFETVNVLAGKFDNCAKIKIETRLPFTKETAYVWLAKNIGLVKWERTTKRIDELVSWKIPKGYPYNGNLSPTGYIPVNNYEPLRNAQKDIQDAIIESKKTGKHVILNVGGFWCNWCRIMDLFFLEDKKVSEFLYKNYVMVKVNYSKENKNEAALSQYPKISGYPHFFVLDSKGNLLHSQSTGKLDSGDSYSHEAFYSFLRKWAPSD